MIQTAEKITLGAYASIYFLERKSLRVTYNAAPVKTNANVAVK